MRVRDTITAADTAPTDQVTVNSEYVGVRNQLIAISKITGCEYMPPNGLNMGKVIWIVSLTALVGITIATGLSYTNWYEWEHVSATGYAIVATVCALLAWCHRPAKHQDVPVHNVVLHVLPQDSFSIPLGNREQAGDLMAELKAKGIKIVKPKVFWFIVWG